MEYKDRTVTLLGQKISISFMKNVLAEDGSWLYGSCNDYQGSITMLISTHNSEGKALDKNTVDLTLRHELFHAIFDRLQMREYSDNEILVEWLASATQELHKQGLTI